MDEERVSYATGLKFFLLFSKIVLGGFTAPFNMIYWGSCCCPVSNTAFSLEATTQWYGALIIIIMFLVLALPVTCCCLMPHEDDTESDSEIAGAIAKCLSPSLLVAMLVCSLCMGVMLQYSSLSFDLAELHGGGVSAADWIGLVFIILAWLIVKYTGVGDEGAIHGLLNLVTHN